jgi:hypothetical protein
MLFMAGDYGREFASTLDRGNDDLIRGAMVWVISRIWENKRDTKTVFTPGLLDELRAVKKRRDQQVALHIAVNRLAKYASDDSFAAGMKVRVSQVLEQAAMHQLAEVTAQVEIGVPPLALPSTKDE